jgi:hypothetical protein
VTRDLSPYLSVPTADRRLRVALLVPALEDETFGMDVLLDDLRAADYIDLAGVYRVEYQQPSTPRLSLSLRGYRAFDDLVCSEGPAETSVDGVPITIDELRRSLEQRKTQGEPIDVLLCPVYVQALLTLAELAREGLWWQGVGGTQSPQLDYVHDLRATVAGDCPVGLGLWIAESATATPRCVMSASTRQVSSFSVNLNISALHPLRRHLWLAALRRLLLKGTPPEDAPQPPCEKAAVSDAAVNELTMARWVCSMAVRHIRRRIKRRGVVEEWRVGWRPLANAAGQYANPDGYRWLEATESNWFADPQLITRNGHDWIFMEEFDQVSGKGRIVCSELDINGLVAPPTVVLELPYHLSYPNVFSHGDDVFLIPETGFNNTVELYRAVDFPHRWERVRVLYRGPAFDTTMCYHEGRFWFFTSFVEGARRVATQLLLFGADRIDGDWKLHPQSPLSCESRWARNAGGIFRDDGKLIRPAQDCSVDYGGALRFREITRFNECEYQESPDGIVLPGSWPATVGVHSYSRNSRFEAIDRLVRREHDGRA